MKTLKQLAASYNLYTAEDIPANWQPYFNERLKGVNYSIPKELNSMQSIEIDIFFECRIKKNYKDEQYFYIEHYYTLVKASNSDIFCMLKQRKGKYYLHPYYSLLRPFDEIDFHIRNEITSNIKEPNQIGVFTEKKVNDWLLYCDSFYNANIELLSLHNSKVNEKQQIIDNTIKNLPGADVQRWNQQTRINTKLFEIIYNLDKKSGYLHTEINFKGNESDIFNLLNK